MSATATSLPVEKADLSAQRSTEHFPTEKCRCRAASGSGSSWPMALSGSPRQPHPTRLTACLGERPSATWSCSQTSLSAAWRLEAARTRSATSHGARAASAAVFE